MVQYGQIWFKIVHIGPEWFQTCPKWFKRVQKGPIWSNMVQICLKIHPIGSGITRSPGLVFISANFALLQGFSKNPPSGLILSISRNVRMFVCLCVCVYVTLSHSV